MPEKTPPVTREDVHREVQAARAEDRARHAANCKRLDVLEANQRELLKLATQGKTGLRVLLWIGGGAVAIGTFLTGLYNAWRH